jgi:hypothetical protein
MQVWMVFGAVFCFRKIFGEILQKIGEISSQPSGNTVGDLRKLNPLQSSNICKKSFRLHAASFQS